MRAIAVSSLLFALLVPVSPAQAIPETFVSGTGNDANSCTRAAPCATFARAETQTNQFGVIRCLDAGNFASSNLTITRSLTIDCTGVGGIISAGVSINNTDLVVILRGLLIDGQGTNPIGVFFGIGSALYVENCRISGFHDLANAGGPGISGMGIRFEPPGGATAKLYVTDTVIADNGLPGSGGGIVIKPIGSGSSAHVELARVVMERNTYGLFANGLSSTGVIAVQIRDSVIAGNTFNGVSAFTAAGGATTSLTLDRSASTLNGGSGVLSQGPAAFVFLGNATVMGNSTGLSAASGGQIFSYQNNQLSGNVSDGAPTAVLTVR
jgi:hypothetical protein